VASAPEQLALLVLAHLLPALLDHAAQRPFLGEPRDGGGDWLVAHRFEVNWRSTVARTARIARRLPADPDPNRQRALDFSG
jgi:hypothetical protein